MANDVRVPMLAITGGPCAGKTTVLGELRRRGTIGGRRALFVAESATALLDGGLTRDPDLTPFQTAVMSMQLGAENACLEYAARCSEPCVVICDRGCLDGAAYLTSEQFDSICRNAGTTRGALLARYDAVIHMESAAVRDMSDYQFETNAQRLEMPSEAVTIDGRNKVAWIGAKSFHVIDATDSFDEKVEKTINLIESIVRGMR